jgi:hypothetical protein
MIVEATEEKLIELRESESEDDIYRIDIKNQEGKNTKEIIEFILNCRKEYEIMTLNSKKLLIQFKPHKGIKPGMSEKINF